MLAVCWGGRVGGACQRRAQFCERPLVVREGERERDWLVGLGGLGGVLAPAVGLCQGAVVTHPGVALSVGVGRSGRQGGSAGKHAHKRSRHEEHARHRAGTTELPPISRLTESRRSC